MGTCFAPSYANLFLGWWEQSRVFGDENPHRSVVWYCRYIDDLLFIWQGDLVSLSNYLTYLNCNDINLKFTLEYNPDAIAFLDIKLSHDKQKICTTGYRKPTAGNTILHYTSCHPEHVTRNIPYGEFLRARRNCTSIIEFENQAEALRKRFADRGYPSNIVNKAYIRAKHRDRHSLIGTNTAKTNRCKKLKTNKNSSRDTYNTSVSFITDYSAEYEQVKRIVQNNLPLLKADKKLRSTLNDSHDIKFFDAKIRDVFCSQVKCIFRFKSVQQVKRCCDVKVAEVSNVGSASVLKSPQIITDPTLISSALSTVERRY
ncbi:LOW QUALITY PROTEIN: uncharacterized protein RCH25_006654 [Pelodytes ibericus]